MSRVFGRPCLGVLPCLASKGGKVVGKISLANKQNERWGLLIYLRTGEGFTATH
jgi:hypothetical protein